MALIQNIKARPTILSDNNLIELATYETRKATDMQPTTKSTVALSSLNCYKADWKCIQKEVLEQDWPVLLSAVDIDIKLKEIMTTTRSICSKNAPEMAL